MSVSITTVNIGDFPLFRAHSEVANVFCHLDALDELLGLSGGQTMTGGTVLDGNSFLTTLLLQPSLFLPHVPQLPTPVCTADFPDRLAERPTLQAT